tara:strand:- start:288 stop:494 length:207 start_codon:yes stop_codon:yes gene_type:complete
MSDHKEIMKNLSDKMVDIQNSFITKISHQVIENLKSIKLLDDRIAKLEKENIDLKIEVSKEFGGTTNE